MTCIKALDVYVATAAGVGLGLTLAYLYATRGKRGRC